MSDRIGVVVDSSALLPPELGARARVTVVPIAVALDGVTYEESELDVDRFYERLAAGVEVSTATAGPGAFLRAYERLAAGGVESVLSLHLDDRLSGVVGAARLGAEEAAVAVEVVDTGQVSFGVALCALAARQALDAGNDAETAVAAARRLGGRLRNASFVAVPAATGRVAAADALVEVADGATSVLDAAGPPEAAAARLAEIVLATEGPLGVAVGHAAGDAVRHADRLAEALAAERRIRCVRRYRVGPSVGAHTGPAAFGCFWWSLDGDEPYPGIGLD